MGLIPFRVEPLSHSRPFAGLAAAILLFVRLIIIRPQRRAGEGVRPIQDENEMNQLLTSLQSLLAASWEVVIALLVLVLPWTPLLAWVAFWLLAVNWVKLRDILLRGGWIGVVLMGLVMVLVWPLATLHEYDCSKSEHWPFASV